MFFILMLPLLTITHTFFLQVLLSDHARLVLQSADVDPRTNEDPLRYKKRRFNAI